MTLKHINFDDSVIMRSFTKTAFNKGIIKTEKESVLDKFVKNKPVEASENFSENILRLCSALRARGFTAQASGLEEKFMLFKSAEATLYETSTEKGEDLIEEAHPDGSVDIVDEPQGEVETVLDQHKKILEMIQKEPDGKLDSKAQKLINQVKVVLAEENATETRERARQVILKGLGFYKDRVRAAYNEIINKVVNINDSMTVTKALLSDKEMTLFKLINRVMKEPNETINYEKIYEFKAALGKPLSSSSGDAELDAIVNNTMVGFNAAIASINTAFALYRATKGTDEEKKKEMAGAEFLAKEVNPWENKKEEHKAEPGVEAQKIEEQKHQAENQSEHQPVKNNYAQKLSGLINKLNNINISSITNEDAVSFINKFKAMLNKMVPNANLITDTYWNSYIEPNVAQLNKIVK